MHHFNRSCKLMIWNRKVWETSNLYWIGMHCIHSPLHGHKAWNVELVQFFPHSDTKTKFYQTSLYWRYCGAYLGHFVTWTTISTFFTLHWPSPDSHLWMPVQCINQGHSSQLPKKASPVPSWSHVVSCFTSLALNLVLLCLALVGLLLCLAFCSALPWNPSWWLPLLCLA